jgi:VWFA-related protein
MSRLSALLSVALSSSVILQGPQVFRLTADAVLVDVSVLKDGRTVPGLTIKDFELRDNGVVQTAQLLPADLPLDVTLVLDKSGSVESIQEQLRAELTGITTLLEPTDQIQVIAFGQRVQVIVPRQAASGTLDIEPKPLGGMTALNDALLLSLTERADRRFRRLVVVFTDGLDNASWLSSRALSEVAKRSEALLMMIVSGRPPAFDTLDRLMRNAQTAGGVLPESMTSLFANTSLDPYVDAAKTTGGDVLDRPARADVASSFAALLRTVRTRYVLAYTPVGVPQAGWHTIKVRVPSKAVDVRARQGYVK